MRKKSVFFKIGILVMVVFAFVFSSNVNAQLGSVTCNVSPREACPGTSVTISGIYTGDDGTSICIYVTIPGVPNPAGICKELGESGFYSYTFSDTSASGTYQVKVVVDPDGAQASNSFKIVYDPIAHINPNMYKGVANQPIEFRGIVTEGKSPYEYDWTFGDGSQGSGQTPEHTYTESGTYNVQLEVTDACGESDTDYSGQAIIADELIANANGPYTGTVNKQVSFSGSATGGFEPYTSWHWDFGDETESEEQEPTHVYTEIGEYTVTLTVTDDEDNTDEDTTTVTIIANTPPFIPTITGENSGKIGVEYTYNFKAVDEDDDNVYFLIDWGDGSEIIWHGPYESGVEVDIPKTFETTGDYQIRAKAKDIYDAESSDWGYLDVSMPTNTISYPMMNILNQIKSVKINYRIPPNQNFKPLNQITFNQITIQPKDIYSTLNIIQTTQKTMPLLSVDKITFSPITFSPLVSSQIKPINNIMITDLGNINKQLLITQNDI